MPPTDTQAMMNAEILTPYPDVVIELLKEIKQIAPYIVNIDVRGPSMLYINFSSDDPLWEMRLWGGHALSCGLICNFHCAPLE